MIAWLKRLFEPAPEIKPPFNMKANREEAIRNYRDAVLKHDQSFDQLSLTYMKGAEEELLKAGVSPLEVSNIYSETLSGDD